VKKTDAAKPAGAPPGTAGDEVWTALAASLRGKLPAAVYTYLKNPGFVTGTFADGVLTLWADSDLVQKAIQKPEVLGIIQAQAESRTGASVRVIVSVGKPENARGAGPQHDNLDDLLAAGRQFGNVIIKD
jgi:hypothetical protein